MMAAPGALPAVYCWPLAFDFRTLQALNESHHVYNRERLQVWIDHRATAEEFKIVTGNHNLIGEALAEHLESLGGLGAVW